MAQIPPTTIEGNLKNLRIIHGALTVSIFLYALLLWRIPPQSTRGMDRTMLAVLAVIVVGEIGAGFVLRRIFIERAFETLRLKPDDAGALASWRTGAILSAALAESIVLYGLVTYLIGGNVRQAWPFFAVGLVVMLVWWPTRP